MDQDDRESMIVEQRLAGTSVPAIAKQFGCSSSEVEAAVDRRLNYYPLDNNMRLRAIKLDVARLEALMVPFYVRALSERDVAAGTLCVKILERRAMLLGLDSPTRIDVVQVQAQEAPSSYSQIRAAIMALKYGNGQQSDDGNGSDDPAAGDGGDR